MTPLATFAIALLAGIPPSPGTSSDGGASDCWTDMPSGATVCVPVGENLVAAVKAQTGQEMIVETSAGVATNLVTGEVIAVSDIPLGVDAPIATAKGSSVAEPIYRSFPGGSFVLLQLYIDANYGTAGGSWSLSAGGQCIGDGTPYGVYDFGASSPSNGYYNNRVSSYHSYFNCASNLYDNANFGGDSTGYAKNRAALGVMNDRGNSVNVYVG